MANDAIDFRVRCTIPLTACTHTHILPRLRWFGAICFWESDNPPPLALTLATPNDRAVVKHGPKKQYPLFYPSFSSDLISIPREFFIEFVSVFMTQRWESSSRVFFFSRLCLSRRYALQLHSFWSRVTFWPLCNDFATERGCCSALFSTLPSSIRISGGWVIFALPGLNGILAIVPNVLLFAHFLIGSPMMLLLLLRCVSSFLFGTSIDVEIGH